MPNKRWKMTSLIPTFRAQWFWIILIHYIWRFISCFTSIWSCRHLYSPEAKSCLVLRSLAWKMLHIIYFDHKVNPCNGCTLRQVPLHMIPNFLTLTPGGHDSSYECDRHCWCRCDILLNYNLHRLVLFSWFCLTVFFLCRLLAL